MAGLLLGALLLILVSLVACSNQTPSPASTQAPVEKTSGPNSMTRTPTNIASTPIHMATPESSPTAATPTAASLTEAVESKPAENPPTAAPTPGASLVIIVAPVPTDVAEYKRSDWKHWIDEDDDCQDARQEVLISESLVKVTYESEKKCRVATGQWYGAFTGTNVEAPIGVDIDHLVPLKNAHDSGGYAWSSTRKQEYANNLEDPDHLIAVTRGANRSKGAKGPEEWRPPDEGYWCQYATDWTEVKMEWGLTMTQRETEAIIEMLDTCEEPVQIEAKSGESASGNGTSRQSGTEGATATPTLVPELESQGTVSVYGSCEDAIDAGESRVQGSAGEGRGFPKEMVPSARDGDGDGVVCER